MMRELSTTAASLSAWPPFDHIEDSTWPMISANTDRLRLRSGAVLAHEGDTAKEFVVVLSGEVTESRGGVETVRTGAGTQIGGRELVANEPYDRTWTAAMDLDVLVVNGPAYRWVARAAHRNADQRDAGQRDAAA
jgi:hypothetical protein